MDDWILDSRATHIMARDKVVFPTLHDYDTKHIYVGDNWSLRVEMSWIVKLDVGALAICSWYFLRSSLHLSDNSSWCSKNYIFFNVNCYSQTCSWF